MKLIYPAIFTPCIENSGYTVVIPDLPDCVSEGISLIDAIDMGTDAACGWIFGELEDGNSFPSPTPHEKIKVEDGSFINLLVLDIDSYIEKYSNKTVRKNITLPAWLNTFGESHNVNFSKVLQDALLDMAQNP